MKSILTILVASFLVIGSAQAQTELSNTFIKMGQQAPELLFPNPSGEDISLNEVNKGRYIILDFWASWCGPCRLSNPALVKMYHAYKDRKFLNAPNGFTVFSVSLDKVAKKWQDAIKKDGLVWPYHVSDLKAWNSKPAEIYGVDFIPQVFLLGPDGKVLGIYVETSEAIKDLEKYLVK